MSERIDHAAQVFRACGGTMRMSEALRAGLTRTTLYGMHRTGALERLSRGVYRLASCPPLFAPDLVTVAKRVPGSVVCLISALDYHGLTMQIPRVVHVALERGRTRPRMGYPPIQAYWYSGRAFRSGVETHLIDGCEVRVYSAEKTVADVFKYRRKIGTDVAVEALRTWISRRGANFGRLLEMARICRVERVMQPYVEAMT